VTVTAWEFSRKSLAAAIPGAAAMEVLACLPASCSDWQTHKR
jgi:hypothetical protein